MPQATFPEPAATNPAPIVDWAERCKMRAILADELGQRATPMARIFGFDSHCSKAGISTTRLHDLRRAARKWPISCISYVL